MTTEVKSIHVFQAAVTSGVLYAFLGVILVPLLMLSGAGNPDGQMSLTTALLMLLLYPLLGFLAGIIVAWCYNMTAGLVGGFRFELVSRS